MPTLPRKLNVGVAYHASPEYLERIKAVDPERLDVTYLWPHLLAEMSADWPARTMERFAADIAAREPMPAAEKEALLRETHVLLMGNPNPKHLIAQVPNLIWAHFNFAGISNLMSSDWYGAEGPMMTSSRGYISPRPIA